MENSFFLTKDVTLLQLKSKSQSILVFILFSFQANYFALYRLAVWLTAQN